MSALSDLLGSSLMRTGGETVDTSAALAGKTAVALYFSAHWCPPCRGFTPQLAEWYKKDLQSKGLEIVFISSDFREQAFKEYFAEQPWLALPFEHGDIKAKLSKKYKVQGIPTLVLLDSEGKLITKDGRDAVAGDPTGLEFPWWPVPVKDLLAQTKLVSSSGETSLQQATEGKKAVALYFSAHWCPPCRGFTPQLAEWYKKDLKAKGLEVVFVSSDRDEEAFKEYFAEMPWLALDYSKQELKEKLSNSLSIEGIPSLVILDQELNVVNKDGRDAVSADPQGLELPWHPKPVKNLKAGPGSIEEAPTIVVFCESSDKVEQKAIEETLTPIARKYLEKQKASGDDLEMGFMMGTEASRLESRLREMFGLQASSSSPCMVLVDIPSEGAYYLAEQGTEISTATVERFIDDFQAGKLELREDLMAAA